jgi:transposase
VLTETGRPCVQMHVAHTAAGITELITRLRAITGPDHQEDMICVLETKTGLLVTALLEAGFALYPVNPKKTDRWRPASGAKSDVGDARLLAKIARSDWQELTRLQWPSEGTEQLRVLVHDREGLLKEQTRLSNQLKACLKAYYPVVLEALTTDMTQTSLHAFLLAYPTPQLAQQASCAQLAALFKACHSSYAQATAERLWKCLHQPALEATEAMVQAKALLVQSVVPTLQSLRQSLHTYDQRITKLYQQQKEYALFESLPGAGLRLGPRLLADLTAFDVTDLDARDVQEIAGTAPVTKKSGKSHQVLQRMACNKPLRTTLYQYCIQTLKHVPWAKAFYDEKRAQGKKHAGALRSLANIWIRILWAMRRTQSRYEEATFVRARQRHGGQAA